MDDRKPTVCLVGVGLIAGSLGQALRRRGFAGEVVGLGRNAASLARAVQCGAIHRYALEPSDAVSDADLVILGVPLGATDAVFEAIRDHLPAHAVITDVGSAKGCVVESARSRLGEALCRFVPGHPIAGTEHSGVEAAFDHLFVDRRVILTPLPETDPRATERVRAMWQAVGAEVRTMSVAHHDRVLAITSHLPHMLAFGLVDSLSRNPDHEEILQYAAGGFRDFTRIASSDPVMWRDICLGNRQALLDALHAYREDLEVLARQVEQADAEGLEAIFHNAKHTRDAYLEWFEGTATGERTDDGE